jgi:ABC-2 type transport system permease protein
MKKAMEVFRREYVERVRKKSFLILTLLGPFLLSILVAVPQLLIGATPDQARRLAVLDLSGRLARGLEDVINTDDNRLGDGSLRYPIEVVDHRGRELEVVQQELNARIGEGSLFGYLVIPEDLEGETQISYYARNTSNLGDQDAIRGGLSNAVIPLRFQDAGLTMDAQEVLRRVRRVRLDPVQIGEEGQVEASGQTAQIVKLVTAYGMLMIFYMTLLLWGVSIMRGVVEEKSSKVVEVLLSSVTSRQLLSGKILGIGAVALTQYLVWAGTGIVAYFVLASSSLDLGGGLATLSIGTVFAFLGYFVLGYFFYASVFAAMGACSTSDQDMQQFQTVGTIPAVIGLLVSFYAFTNADTAMATVLSLIPPFTPFVMIVRTSVMSPPLWEVALSVVSLLAGIVVMMWLAAKIFRIGILMTGKKPTFAEIFRWLRYA